MKRFRPLRRTTKGSALWKPASLSGKRLDLNPLPLCLFVQTFSKQLLFHYRKVGHFSEICIFQISEKCPIKIPIFGFNTYFFKNAHILVSRD